MMDRLQKHENLRIEEVADYFQVSNRTVRRWIHDGILDAHKIKGTVRITKISIEYCMRMKKV